MDQSTDSPADENILREDEFSMEGYDKHIRKARNTLFAVAAINLLGLYPMLPIDNSVKTVITVIVVLIAGIFVALGFWTKKKPYTAILTGLIVYVSILALDTIAQPLSLVQGWWAKVFIILFLVLGLGNARDIQRMMEAFGKNK
jgi:hypothetical protein